MRFDITVKNMSSNHKLSVGCFPNEFTGNPKKCMLEVKDNNIIAREEVPKVKKTIKLGKIVEENCGTKINQFKGIKLGGQTANHILFVLEDKKFRAYPIDSWFDFKKEIVNVDSRTQMELENYSNDPLYEQKVAKMKQKDKSSANRLIEDLSAKARKETGMEEVEEHTMK